jgi:hypothetical protein
MNTTHILPHLISFTVKAENSIPLSPLKNLCCELSVVVLPFVFEKLPQCDVTVRFRFAVFVLSLILYSSIVP